MPVDYSLSRRMRWAKWTTAPTLLLFLLSLCLSPLAAIAAPQEQPNTPYFHIIKPGESLARIAALYGVSVQELRDSNDLVNVATVVSCDPNADSTQARGTVRLNGQPANGYRVVFSWQPDGQVVARVISGGGGQQGGQFSHILEGSGPREGDWWFWIENEFGARISETAHVYTDEHAHTGRCQRAVIDFDVRNPDLTYVGRRLHIPVGGNVAVGGPGPAPSSAPVVYRSYHIVRSGQTVTGIADLYGIPAEALREANGLYNRASVAGCDPNADSTRARGTVRLNGQPVDGYRVAFSWEPDGEVVARRLTGEGAFPGFFTHILEGGGPREGDWWFWVENSDEERISEMAHFRTDSHSHEGNCQWAVLDFDIQNPGLTYVGRKLHISVGEERTAVWAGTFYNNRNLDDVPVLYRQDASIRFDWQAGHPGTGVLSDNFSAVWTTTSHFQAGTYRFFTLADDGARVYVDDVLVLEDWNIHPATQSFADVYLSQGDHTIRVEYFEAEGFASISVWWEKR